MFFRRDKIKKINVTIYINYGNDKIRHQTMGVSSGTSILEVLKNIAEIEFNPDEPDKSVTDRQRSVVTFIDGVRADADHCWIYYVFDQGNSGWRIPKEMPDKLETSDKMRIGWRYYDIAEKGPEIKDGPLWTSWCVSKTRVCSREFLRISGTTS
ncbi:MAG: hypothetical protein ACXQT4_00520 [Methanotrichaceae archaeon]